MVLVYWYGGLLRLKGMGIFGEFFKVFLIFVNISCVIGEVGVLILDFVKVLIVINLVFQILDWKIEIDFDVWDVEGVDVVKGQIEFIDVYFVYLF